MERYAVANGDSNDVATWDGGTTLPGVDDDCYSNGYTVDIIADFTVKSLHSDAGATAVAGGTFLLETDAVTVTCTGPIKCGAGTPGLTVNITSGEEVTVNCSEADGTSSDANSNGGVVVTGGGTVNLNMDAQGGSANSRASIVFNGATCDANIVGDMTGANGQAIYANNGTLGDVVIVGDMTGGTRHAAYIVTGCASLTVVGTVTGGGSEPGIELVVTGSVSVTGNCYSGAGNPAVYSLAGAVEVTGNAVGQNNQYCLRTTSSTITVNGTTTNAGSNQPAIYNPGGQFYANGPLIFAPSVPCFSCRYIYIDTDDPIEWAFTKGDGTTDRTLYTADAGALGQADEADVRDGTVFGPSNEFTGTCKIPPAASVLQDVPVDATVGTLAIESAGIRIFRAR